MERSSIAARSPTPRLKGRLGGGFGLGRAFNGGSSRLRGGPRERIGDGLAAIAARRRLRRALICALIAAPLLGGGWLWLRHSSFVKVDHVRISGVHGLQAAQIEAALREAAKGMSTLDVRVGALREAVARYPQVSELRAVPSFPHSLRIVVGEQPPAAALVVGGVRTAVAADGVALGTQLVSSNLPTVSDNFEPAIGQRLSNPLVLDALRVLGAAPAPLAKLAETAYFSPRGLTVKMRNGLLIYFGDATRPHAKWLAFARVLADSTSAGAVYVDVRLPDRPAAGGLEHLAGTEGKGEGSTVATLAESLTGGKKEAAKIGEGTGEGTSESSREKSLEGAAGGGREASSEGRGEAAPRAAGAEGGEGSEAATEPSG